MSRVLPKIALMLGNVVIGLSVLSPAGMLAELAKDLRVELYTVGLLVTYGAVVVCIGSPVGAWLTTRVDRRTLLFTVIATIASCEIATALAPNYATVLALRLVMMAFAAVYTPQAAATVSLIVSERERPASIALVFLGWSIAIAGGMPVVTALTQYFGWREAYGALGIMALALAVMLRILLPAGLTGYPLSLGSFGTIARNGPIILILLFTFFTTCGQFTVVVYLVPLLDKLAGQGPATAGMFFALLGAMGVVGNIIASAIVPRIGVQRTLAIFLASILTGMLLWAFSAGVLAVLAASIFFWGLGFAASNSMQQARLVTASPDLASASIALNTSILYIGQAVGSGATGLFFAHMLYRGPGYFSVACGIAAALILALTWQPERRAVRPAE